MSCSKFKRILILYWNANWRLIIRMIYSSRRYIQYILMESSNGLCFAKCGSFAFVWIKLSQFLNWLVFENWQNLLWHFRSNNWSVGKNQETSMRHASRYIFVKVFVAFLALLCLFRFSLHCAYYCCLILWTLLNWFVVLMLCSIFLLSQSFCLKEDHLISNLIVIESATKFWSQ